MKVRVAAKAAVVAGLLGVTGCANAIQSGSPDVTHMLSPEFLAAATAGGEMTTVIYGNPFGPGPVDGEAIARQLSGPGDVPAFRYTTIPSAKANPLYRVILAFNPPKFTYGSGDAACAADAKDLFKSDKPGGGPIAMVATFCAGSKYVSQVTMLSPPAASAETPLFRELMDQTVSSLFPFTRDTELNILQGASFN